MTNKHQILVALFLLCASAAVLGVGFLLAPASPAGNSPVAVALVDFDGDGKLDAVVANSTAGTVSVLPGKGNSTFKAPVTFTVGANPVALVVADFNGDNKPDIAVVNQGSAGSSSVTVLLNTGGAAGSFSFSSATYPLPAGAVPTAIAFGDLDGVNGPDLVVANGTAGGVSILLNTGNGTFGTATSVAAGSNALAVAVADFKISTLPDIAVADASGTINILPNMGGTPLVFGAPVPIVLPNGAVPSAMLSGDFNIDGKPDLAVADSANDQVIVLLNTSTGATPAFGTAATYGVELMPVALALGDVNVDGFTDIVAANKTSRSVSVLLNSSATPGKFTVKSHWAMGPDPVGVAVGDIGNIDGNNDGRPDIVTANMSGNSISGLLGLGPLGGGGIFYGPRNYIAGKDPVSIFTAGIASPGEFDIAAANHDSNNISLLFNTNTGALNNYFFAPNPPIEPTDIGPRGILIGSFHPGGGADVVTANDGLATIVTATESSSTVTVTTSAADGFVVSQMVTISGAGVAGYNGTFVITAVPTTTTFQYVDPSTGLAASTGGTATTSGGNDVTVNSFKNGGTFSFSGTFALPAGTIGPRGIAGLSLTGKPGMAIPDFTGDLATGKNVTVFLQGNSNNNMVILQPPVNYQAHTNPAAVATGDFNGDGNTDVAIANNGSNDVSILFGNGDGTFQAPQNFLVGSKPLAIAVGDFNGDGKPDLAIANNADNTVTILLNTTPTNSSTFSFTTGGPYPVSTNPEEIRAIDVNNDGILDLVVGSDNPNGLNVLLGNGAKGKGDGTFQAAQMFVVGNAPTSVASGDFNADAAADVVFSNGKGNDVTVVLNEGGDKTALNANPTSGVGPYTLTATITPTVPQINVPAGTVTFTDNVLRLGTTTDLSPTASVAPGSPLGSTGFFITPGVAMQTYTLTGGTQVVTGTYSGDNIFNANTLPSVTLQVGNPVNCIVSSSINPVHLGESVIYTATINSPSGTPSGTVQFTDNGASLGSPATLNASGAATLANTYMTAAALGAHSISFTYFGDATHQGCSSVNPFTETVIKAPTATTLTSSLNPSLRLQNVIFTATVTTNFAPPPLGTVTFFADGVALGAAVPLNGAGQAQFPTATLSAGSHFMTAQYNPGTDPVHAASTSPTLVQVVNLYPSTTTLVSSVNPAVVPTNTTVTFTATVNGAAGVAPAGNVQFFDFGTSIGTSALGALTASSSQATLTLNIPAQLAVGAHLITAVYAGDANYASSRSAELGQIVKTATQTTTNAVLTSAPPPPVESFQIYAQKIVFTATISPAPVITTAENVTFYDGNSVLGTAALNSSGVAKLSIGPNSVPTLARGEHTVFAVYGGDTNFSASISSALSLQRTVRPH